MHLFTTRYLTLADLPIIMNLQQKVSEQLQSKDTLQALTPEEFTTILTGDRLMIGMFDQERLISFRAMLTPEVDDPHGHLGLDAGLPEHELSHVIYSEVSVVDPAYRGKRLQTTMGLYLFERINREQFHHVCATVAPDNIPSLKDKLMLGMEISALKEKYDGKLRFILYKNLRKDQAVIHDDETVKIPLEDIAKQEQMLADGYVGVLLIEEAGAFFIGYLKA